MDRGLLWGVSSASYLGFGRGGLEAPMTLVLVPLLGGIAVVVDIVELRCREGW